MRFRLLAAALVVVYAAACSDDAQQNPTGDPLNRPAFAPPAVNNPYCQVVTVSGIQGEIHNLYVQNAWPNENSAQGKFNNVQNLVGAGDLNGARSATRDLVGFVTLKFNQLTASQQQAAQGSFNQLVSDLYCYVGISGTVYDLNPGDPEKAFSVPGVGGVDFPANVVPVGTLVSITDISGLPSPLVTPLDVFPGYLAISLYPPATLSQPAVVVLCPGVGFPSTLAVGHQDDVVGFEILTPTAVPALLSGTCGSSSQLTAPKGTFQQLLADAARVLLPSELQASMMFAAGIGGLTTKFSPVGIVNTTLTGTSGLGGSTTKFAPPVTASAKANGSKPATSAKNGAVAAPPNNPPLPQTVVQGGAGTSSTSGLPFVTVATPGGDANGVNPVPGVTVTFTIEASINYSPASNAQVCTVQGGVPTAQASVQVVTDANGVATLPCLIFGNTAGFVNLKATFDPTSLNFPNANLVTIVTNDGTTTGSSLYWLVQTTAGAAAKLAFVTSPSAAAQAGVPLAQQPTVQLLDGFNNEIYTAGITITAAVTAGGGTASYTAPVNTDANGVGTFTNLSIGGAVAGTAQTVSFTFPGISQALTAGVQLSAGPANKLAITTQPSANAQAGVPFPTQPVIAIQDQYGNQTSSTAQVAASIASGSPTLAGTTSINVVNGVATFTNLEIDGTTGVRTLGFASAGLTGATSGNVTVAAGSASKLVITTQPSSNAQAGVPFAVQPVVAIEDQFNNVVNSNAAVVASIVTGAGTLVGSTSVAAVSGVATYANLEIDGLVGNRNLQFTSGNLTSPQSNVIAVSAGSAATIQTFINNAAAQSYSYGNSLTPYTNVSPNPQVIVKDAFGNPVGNQPVYWSATTANGGVLTVGAAGSPTNGSGLAQVSSWNIGEGLNEATGSLFAPGVAPNLPAYLDATFSASTPTGVSVFACSVGTGTSKTAVAPMSIKTPNASVRTITLYMSVTGQSSAFSNYPATIEIFKNTYNSTVAADKVGSGSGTVVLPGNNGKAQPITFVLSDPATATETKGSSVLWIKLTITAPANRTPQVWYLSGNYKSSDPCYNSLVYTTGYPSNTSFTRGLSINVTN